MKLYMAAILAISFLDIFSEGLVRGSFGSQMIPQNQCIDLRMEKIDIRAIASYKVHERPFKAVIFITNSGIQICVPHDLPWVQKTIRNLNKRPKPRAQNRRKSSSRRRAMSTSRPKAGTS